MGNLNWLPQGSTDSGGDPDDIRKESFQGHRAALYTGTSAPEHTSVRAGTAEALEVPAKLWWASLHLFWLNYWSQLSYPLT